MSWEQRALDAEDENARLESANAALERQLQQAERRAQIHIGQAWQREDITKAERDAARALGEGLYLLGEVWVHQRDEAIKRGAEAWCWGQAGWNTARKWLVWHDDEQRLKDAAIRRAEAQEEG